MELGRITGSEGHFLEAIKIAEDLLEKLAKEFALNEWYGLHHDLGNAQFEIGKCTHSENILNDALASYRIALQGVSREDNSREWAGATYNIGRTLLQVAEVSGNFDRVDEAIASCRAALEIFEFLGWKYDALRAREKLAHAIISKPIFWREPSRASSCAALNLLLSTAKTSHPLHKTIHHALFAGAVERDRQLVAVDGGDVAVAEFLVEDAVAQREGGDRTGRFRHQLAFDGERQAAGAAGAALLAGAPGGGG